MSGIRADDLEEQKAYKKKLLDEISAISKTEHTDMLKAKQDHLKSFVDWQSANELEKFKKSTKRVTVPPAKPSRQKLDKDRHKRQMQGFREVLEHYKLELRNPKMQSKDAEMKPRFDNFYTPFPNRYIPSQDGKLTDEYWGAGQSGKWTKPII